MMLLMLIPIANLIVSILLAVNLAKAFGKGTGFAVGLILLPGIFYLIIPGDNNSLGNIFAFKIGLPLFFLEFH